MRGALCILNWYLSTLDSCFLFQAFASSAGRRKTDVEEIQDERCRFLTEINFWPSSSPSGGTCVLYRQKGKEEANCGSLVISFFTFLVKFSTLNERSWQEEKCPPLHFFLKKNYFPKIYDGRKRREALLRVERHLWHRSAETSGLCLSLSFKT